MYKEAHLFTASTTESRVTASCQWGVCVPCLVSYSLTQAFIIRGEHAASRWPALGSKALPTLQYRWVHLHNLLISAPSLRKFPHILSHVLLISLWPLQHLQSRLLPHHSLFESCCTLGPVCPSALCWYVCVCVVLPLAWVPYTLPLHLISSPPHLAVYPSLGSSCPWTCSN